MEEPDQRQPGPGPPPCRDPSTKSTGPQPLLGRPDHPRRRHPSGIDGPQPSTSGSPCRKSRGPRLRAPPEPGRGAAAQATPDIGQELGTRDSSASLPKTPEASGGGAQRKPGTDTSLVGPRPEAALLAQHGLGRFAPFRFPQSRRRDFPVLPFGLILQLTRVTPFWEGRAP